MSSLSISNPKLSFSLAHLLWNYPTGCRTGCLFQTHRSYFSISPAPQQSALSSACTPECSPSGSCEPPEHSSDTAVDATAPSCPAARPLPGARCSVPVHTGSSGPGCLCKPLCQPLGVAITMDTIVKDETAEKCAAVIPRPQALSWGPGSGISRARLLPTSTA